MKKTKIITSIGPAIADLTAACQLFQKGSDIARINFSHGNPQEHLPKIKMIRQAARKVGRPWALLLDTKGPEIRTHNFANGQAQIKKGSQVTIYLKEEVSGNDHQFSITYQDLDQDLQVGDAILVDDGYLKLIATKISSQKIVCQAVNSHLIANRRGINIPGRQVALEFLSAKDRADIIFGCQQNFDFMALSFVQSAADIAQVRALLQAQNKEHIKLIAKIESKGGVENFDQILQAADGIMVARGDLGVEIDPVLVPTYQKRWIRECNKVGKPIIVATQMLESMINNPRPTRAEVSDVYNAIEDGTSSIMLSGESAKGQYFLEAVSFMNRIAATSEKYFDSLRYFNRMLRDAVPTQYDSLVKDIFRSTVYNTIDHILVLVNDPFLIKAISQVKPQALIHPLCQSEQLVNSYALAYGVYPFASSKPLTFTDEQAIKKIAFDNNLAVGQTVLLVNSQSLQKLTL